MSLSLKELLHFGGRTRGLPRGGGSGRLCRCRGGVAIVCRRCWTALLPTLVLSWPGATPRFLWALARRLTLLGLAYPGRRQRHSCPECRPCRAEGLQVPGEGPRQRGLFVIDDRDRPRILLLQVICVEVALAVVAIGRVALVDSVSSGRPGVGVGPAEGHRGPARGRRRLMDRGSGELLMRRGRVERLFNRLPHPVDRRGVDGDWRRSSGRLM